MCLNLCSLDSSYEWAALDVILLLFRRQLLKRSSLAISELPFATKIYHCHMKMSWLCMKTEVQVKHIITRRLVLRRRQKWAHKCFPPTRSGNEIKTWRWCHAISTQKKHKHLRTKISDSVMNRTSSQKHLWLKNDPRFVVCIISYFPKPDGRILFVRLNCSILVGYSRHQHLAHESETAFSTSTDLRPTAAKQCKSNML